MTKKKRGKGKAKGNAFERHIMKELCATFAHCGIGIHDASRSTLSGGLPDSYGDISMSARLAELFPFSIECKFYKSINLNALFQSYKKMTKACWFKKWWEQTLEGSAKCDRSPLLVFKANGQDVLCAFYLDTLKLTVSMRIKHLSKFHIMAHNHKVNIVRYKDFLKIISEECSNGGKGIMVVPRKIAKTTSRS